MKTRIPSKYSLPEEVKTVVVLPIAKNNVPIGFLCTHFEFKISDEIKKSLIAFSQYARKTIIVDVEKSNSEISQFSHREIETLTLISEGWNTLQIAQYLSISEATVKHYIKTFMKRSNTFTDRMRWDICCGMGQDFEVVISISEMNSEKPHFYSWLNQPCM